MLIRQFVDISINSQHPYLEQISTNTPNLLSARSLTQAGTLHPEVYLGVGPFGLVFPCGVVELAAVRILGVEGVSGVMRGEADEGLVGVRGATRG